MSDVFEIVPRRTSKPRNSKTKENTLANYVTLQGEFINQSLGYYTYIFIDKIVSRASKDVPEVQVLSVTKLLRDIVRKFLMSDLEVVFLGHICSLLEWNVNLSILKQNSHKLRQKVESLHPKAQILNLFLHLVAYFVKSYLSQIQESLTIKEYLMEETSGEWEYIYEEWLKTCQVEIFRISPRAINTLYSQFSKDCQKNNSAKNYNCMVDRILELSTTYSMMPGDSKQGKSKKKRTLNEDKQIQAFEGRKIVKRNTVSNRMSRLSKDNQIEEAPQMKHQQSLFSNNFLEGSIFRQKQSDISQPMNPINPKKAVLRSKNKNQEVSNHISEFYSKKQYEAHTGKDEYKPESTIGFQNNSYPSFLDFNNRSSRYEAIPYTLRNNSNISNFWL